MSCPGNVPAASQQKVGVSLALSQLKEGIEAGCSILPNLGLGDTTGQVSEPVVVAGGGVGIPGPTGGTRHQEPLWRWQGGEDSCYQGVGGAPQGRLKQVGNKVASRSSNYH